VQAEEILIGCFVECQSITKVGGRRSVEELYQALFFVSRVRLNVSPSETKIEPDRRLVYQRLRVRFFGRIRKRICDPRSYGFFDAKEKQNPKKDYFVVTRQAGGTQYVYQNDISLVLP